MTDTRQKLEEELEAERKARRRAETESEHRAYFAALGCGASGGFAISYLVSGASEALRHGWVGTVTVIVLGALSLVSGLLFQRVVLTRDMEDPDSSTLAFVVAFFFSSLVMLR